MQLERGYRGALSKMASVKEVDRWDRYRRRREWRVMFALGGDVSKAIAWIEIDVEGTRWTAGSSRRMAGGGVLRK